MIQARIAVRSVICLTMLALIACEDQGTRSVRRDFQTKGGILYINDEPFIPTGVYFWPDISRPTGRNPFEDITYYGLNTLVVYYEYVRPDRTITNQPDIDEVRDECDRLGIYYFVGAPTGEEVRDKTDDELEALFTATTDRVFDSPHFLGWMFDEPALNGIDLEQMERITSAIHLHDAPQLIWFNFAPVDGRWDQSTWPDMDAYADLADIVGFDFYPVGMGLPWIGWITKSTVEDFGWYVDQARTWVNMETPVWMIQQGYEKGDVGELPPSEDSRRPDSIETRFMTFQAIAHGASGIFYFPGSRLGTTIPFDDPTWDIYIRNTAREVQNLSEILTSTEPPEETETFSSAIKTLTFRYQGKTTLLAVRETDGDSLRVTFSFSETMGGPFDVLGENRTVIVQDGSFADTFQRYDIHIYVSQ